MSAPRHIPASARLLGVSLLLAACEGQIGGLPGVTGGGGSGGSGGSGGGAGGTGGQGGVPLKAPLVCNPTPSPGTSPQRRLTNEEWRNTVSDLLGQDALAAQLAAGFTSETVSLGFRNNARFLDVQQVMAQKYMDAAEKLAAAAVAPAALPSLLPCDPAALGEAACALEFIKATGRRAYRRPLTAAEITAYQKVYSDLRAPYDFKTGIEGVLFTMLQSQNFLYRVEIPPTGSLARVTGYEMASRLSYLIWHSAPDEALLTAAADGRLATAADLEREARRLLADPKGRRFKVFFEEWLDADEIPAMTRDSTIYPELNPELRGLFAGETASFVEEVMGNAGGKLETLLGADWTMMNDKLAAHYRTPGVTGSAFQKVPYTSPRRAGILSQAGVIAVHDKPTRSSIVLRGLKVRTELLCQTLGSPPNDVKLDLGPIDPMFSQAERLAEHRKNPVCASCHAAMDPIGSTFEELDALGRDRTADELGRPLYAKGEMIGTTDMDGPLDGQADLARKLARSEDVRDCVTLQMFRYGMGRAEEDADKCSIASMYDRFAGASYDLRELVLGITQSEAFLYAQPVQP